MKKYISLFAFILITLVSFSTDIPPGGTNMINDAIAHHSQVGSQGKVKVVDAVQPDFDKAIEVDITSLPENYWNFQVVFQTNMALEQGDICLVSFWARCTHSLSEAGEGRLTAIIEHNKTYEKPLSYGFNVGGEWTHLLYAFKSNMDLSADVHKAAIFFGHAVQTIEIANIQFLNYKNSITLEELPQMEIRWSGMEPDAPWRSEAAERIEKFRKGDVNVKLVDADNNPVAGASVTMTMKRHRFGFGSAIDGKHYLSNATYRNHVHELFNEVVFENDLKWRPWISRSSHAYILQAIDSLNKRNIDVRGHNLIWPGWNYLPDYLDLYQSNPARLEQECLDRIEETAAYTKGRLIDWDVINEPYTNHDIQDICGDHVMIDWFYKTRETDPDAKRYINDYGILSNGGSDINHQNGYYDIIQYIESEGDVIQGIGMQGHFNELVTGIPKLFEILNRFATFNKEIKITEFDINSTRDEMKASYSRDFLTAMFSHPYVKGVLAWGFWEGRHWRPEAAWYNMDWSIRPQGEVWKSLIFEEWWTPAQVLSSAGDGSAAFGSCFLGTYQVEVVRNGESFTMDVPLHFNSENFIVIDVESKSVTIEGTEHPETPGFLSGSNLSFKNKPQLEIYPNPTDSYLQINLDGALAGAGRMEITDISGKRVMIRPMHFGSESRVDVRHLKQGIYFLTLHADGFYETQKFVVK